MRDMNWRVPKFIWKDVYKIGVDRMCYAEKQYSEKCLGILEN